MAEHAQEEVGEVTYDDLGKHHLDPLGMSNQDYTMMLARLRVVFGDAADAPMKALGWLNGDSGPCGGKPCQVAAGKVPGVPREIGVQRVLDYLRDAS